MRKSGGQREVTLWVNEITENVWYDFHTKYTRIVVQIQQITTLNIILKEHKSVIKVPLSELDDVIIVNEHSLGHGTYAQSARGRYFTPNYGSGDYDHKLVGDLVFLHHGEEKITFRNIMDPRSVQNLVNEQRKKLQSIQKMKSITSPVEATKTSAQNVEFSMYRHETFKMDRPSNWIAITNRKASTENFVVVFKDPPLDSIDALSVEIEQITKTMTMDDLIKLDLMSMERNVSNFQLVEITNTFDLSGQRASKIIYDGITQNRLVRHMRISTIKKSLVYRLVFICEAEKFLDRFPTAIRMVDSFKFTTDSHKNDNIKKNSC